MRPSCALPYELVVNGALSDDKRQFAITFEVLTGMFGYRAAGSPFVVYARYGARDLRTRNYAVTPGDQLQDSWQLEAFDNQRFDLTVYGPNGFYREFRGDAHDPLLEVSVEGRRAFSASGTLRGLVEIHIVNRDIRAPQTIEILDVAYKNETQRFTLRPGEKKLHLIDDPESFNWYDFTFRVDGRDSFARRYAGRVETGKAGFSDPVIGRATT